MNMNKGQEYISLIGQFNFSNFAFIKRKADYVISNEIEFCLNPQLVR